MSGLGMPRDWPGEDVVGLGDEDDAGGRESDMIADAEPGRPGRPPVSRSIG